MSSREHTWQGYQALRQNVAVKRAAVFPMFINSAGLLSVRFPARSPVIAPPGGAETGAQDRGFLVAHRSAPLTEGKDMTTLTMIWHDCHSSAMSDFNRHTMNVTDPLKVSRSVLVSFIMHDFYTRTQSSIYNHGLAEAALRKEPGIVGIFIGIPEEL